MKSIMHYPNGMDILYAIILGIIEGITEFLPISSTAHLVVAEDLMNFKDTASLFTVVIQLGAILAATVHFRADLLYIARSVVARDKAMLLFIRNVIFGLLPSLVLGLLVEKTIGLSDSLALIAGALVAGGIIFLLIENKPHAPTKKDGTVRYEAITAQRSWLIGLGQALAIIPGVSRSGATIMTGLMCGLDRKTATVFSFYLSIPVMIGASTLKLIDDRSTLSSVSGGATGLLVGTIVSFVVALLVIRWLLSYVQTNTFKPFAYYRIGVGLTILAVLTVQNFR